MLANWRSDLVDIRSVDVVDIPSIHRDVIIHTSASVGVLAVVLNEILEIARYSRDPHRRFGSHHGVLRNWRNRVFLAHSCTINNVSRDPRITSFRIIDEFIVHKNVLFYLIVSLVYLETSN